MLALRLQSLFFMLKPHLEKSLVLFFTLALITAPLCKAVDAAAYVIADSTTGTILESSNPSKKLQIGSLTKIATAMVVLDWSAARSGDLTALVSIPDSALPVGSPQGVGFEPGESCSVRDLLYAALMQSDNVAAITLANHVGKALGGSTTKVAPVITFVVQMNALARRLGMTHTRFINPHGLDQLESTLPYSTAEDLAKLTSYAMANSAFRFYVSQKERKIAIAGGASGQRSYLLRNTNELLGINAIDGVKTGSTNRAGQCLIISAAKSPESRQQGETHIVTPRRLNVVVLNSPNRFDVASALLNRGWQLYEKWSAAGRPKNWTAPR